MIQYRTIFPALIFFLIFAGSAAGVMPPEHYARMAENSRIRATAVVDSVEVLETTKESTRKKVVFSLRHDFGMEVPEIFSGICFSVDWPWQKPMAGGTIYFYPEKGDLVFVTVAADGGHITSYTYLDENLETLFVGNPDRIRFGMGDAHLEL
jgi:hypothetical protein